MRNLTDTTRRGVLRCAAPASAGERRPPYTNTEGGMNRGGRSWGSVYVRGLNRWAYAGSASCAVRHASTIAVLGDFVVVHMLD